MKCEEVQFHFSDYLEKTAEGPRSKGIENHLTGCPICREELSWLLQCRDLIASLPAVEPPLGFTTRVMANVAEAAKKTSFWKRVFLPLKVKVPLEATAVVLLGILSFYVYQNEAPNSPVVPPMSQDLSPTHAKVSETPAVAAQAAPAAAKQTRSIRQSSNKSAPAAGATATTGSDALRTATVSDNPLQKTFESRRSFAIPAQGVVAGMGLSADMGMVRRRPFRLFPAEGELPNLGEPVADYELYVRVGSRRGRQVKSADNSANKNEKADTSSSSNESTKFPNLQRSPVLSVMWYIVRQEQYEQFKSELADQATIESEIPVGIKDRQWSFRSDGPLYIKVTLLGPND